MWQRTPHNKNSKWVYVGIVILSILMNTLDDILELAPKVFGRGKWAMFGLRCLWWSSDPVDCVFVDGGPLPRCPYCGGLLDQKSLAEFIEEAKADPALYGPAGLKALVAAHHSSGKRCYQFWEEYI